MSLPRKPQCRSPALRRRELYFRVLSARASTHETRIGSWLHPGVHAGAGAVGNPRVSGALLRRRIEQVRPVGAEEAFGSVCLPGSNSAGERISGRSGRRARVIASHSGECGRPHVALRRPAGRRLARVARGAPGSAGGRLLLATRRHAQGLEPGFGPGTGYNSRSLANPSRGKWRLSARIGYGSGARLLVPTKRFGDGGRALPRRGRTSTGSRRRSTPEGSALGPGASVVETGLVACRCRATIETISTPDPEPAAFR